MAVIHGVTGATCDTHVTGVIGAIDFTCGTHVTEVTGATGVTHVTGVTGTIVEECTQADMNSYYHSVFILHVLRF